MKKVFSLLLALFLAIVLLPAKAEAATVASGTCGDNLTWTLDDQGTLTISGTGGMVDYSYDSDRDYCDSPWYPNRGAITSVVIKDGISSIGSLAFYDCWGLTSVTIPDSVTTIGEEAFYSCYTLSGIVLPKGMTYISPAAFYGCSSLQKITLPEGLTSICESAFSNCAGLMNITIPDGVTYIGWGAFNNCTSLDSIVFLCNAPSAVMGEIFREVTAAAYYPAGNATWTSDVMQSCGGNVTWIEYASLGTCGVNTAWSYASTDGTLTISGTGATWDFREEGNYYDYHGEAPWKPYRDQITKVVIEDGITVLGAEAFANCPRLEEVDFGNTLTDISDFSFMFCPLLKNFELPNTLTSIGQQAFWRCTGLTAVTFPDSLSFLDACTFEDCTALSIVKFKSDPNLGAFVIGNSPFRNCTALKEIIVEKGHLSLNSHEGVLYAGDALLQYPCGKQDASYTILDGTLNIEQFAVEKALHLEKVTIPDSVADIAYGAFLSCKSLSSVSIGDGVASIGGFAFGWCESLTEVQFKGNAPSMGDNVFYEATATIYYPENNATWTSDVMQNYGGTITWVPYDPFSIDKPTVSVAKNSYNSLKVTWSEVPGAKCYEVYRSTNASSGFVKLGIYDSQTFSKVSTGLTIDTKYYYKVRAYKVVDGYKKYSAYSNVVSGTPTLSAPTVRVAQNNYNSLKVTWGKVAGASCYEMYRSTNASSGFVKLGTYDSETFSKVSGSLSTGTKYYYKVRAYRVVDGYKKYSAYSDVVSGIPTLSAPTTVTIAKNGYNSLKVSWSKVAGASFYQVYRSVKGANDWKLLATYDENTFSMTSKQLGTGSTYEYRVRCYRWANSERQFSGWSTVKSGTPTMSAPTGVKAATGTTKGTVTVSWNKVSGATYYQVYRSANGTSDWKLLGTYDEDTLSMTSKSLGSGQTYYYRVRCYRWAGGERQFSTWSTIVNAVAK